MLTIKEALELPAFNEAKLLAGAKGTDQSIKWVTTIEIIEDITRFQEGEFIITTGFGLIDNEGFQNRFLELLQSRKLSGVAIYTGFYLSEIPKLFVDEANTCNLPLIEIPSSINFSTITKALLEQIANKQIKLLENSLHVHQEMTKLAFNIDGLSNTLDKITPLSNSSIFVFDHSLQFIASSKKPAHHVSIEENELHINNQVFSLQELFDSFSEKPITVNEYMCSITEVESDSFTYGYLLTIYKNTYWSEMDSIILNHISTIIGIELVKQYAVDETKTRIQGEFVEEILNKEHLNYQDALKRGERLGYDLTLSHVVLYIKPPYHSLRNPNNINIGNKLHYYLSQSLLHTNRQVIILPKMNELYALVEVKASTILTEQKNITLILEKVQHLWLNHFKEPLRFGIGRSYSDLLNFSESAREAENAIYYSHLLLNESTIISYDDLGFYQVLIKMEKAGIPLKNYYEQYLGQLVDPINPRDDLISTLETYLANNCHIQHTATKLFIHRHTLKYRLNQIEKKTGIHLQSPDARLNLHLAIVAYKYTRLK